MAPLAFKALYLQLHGPGGYRHVNTVQDAAECLLNLWPTQEGPAFEEAVRVALDGMAGRVAPEDVIAAMVEAAEEAGVRMLT